TPTIVPPSPGVPAESETSTHPGRNLVPFPVDQTSQGSEAAQNLLVPLAHQLSLMQKQMFDQFQQAMMMMFQMFNTLQKDQIGVIRQELDHLQNLTQELNKLQSDLMQRAQPAAAIAGAGIVGAQSQPIQPSASMMDAIKPPRV